MISDWAVEPPHFFINFKAYIYGREALKFSKEAERISQKYRVPIVVIPQIIDIAKIAEETSLPVFAPHMDAIKPGRGVGTVLPEAVKEAGGVGVMLNHVERRIPLNVIAKSIERADEVGLVTLVLADKLEDMITIAKMGPNIMGTEPPALIGTGKSVARMNKDFVSKSVATIKKINPKIKVGCGAGNVSGEDVAEIIRLGAEGTGATSGILKAKNPTQVLDEMVKSLRYAWDEKNK